MKVALNLLTSLEDPQASAAGDIYFNILSKNLRIYNGSVWVELTPPSTDPTPFYMHTHTFDGDVHTIDVQNQITFKETNIEASPAVILPIIKGYDGGSPGASDITDILLGGSNVDETFVPSEDTIIGGGSSLDDGGTIFDGGNSI
jgi:hypothetical protein